MWRSNTKLVQNQSNWCDQSCDLMCGHTVTDHRCVISCAEPQASENESDQTLLRLWLCNRSQHKSTINNDEKMCLFPCKEQQCENESVVLGRSNGQRRWTKFSSNGKKNQWHWMTKLSLETPSDKECWQDVQIMQELNLTRCKSPTLIWHLKIQEWSQKTRR